VKDDSVQIRHILDCIEKIETYTQGGKEVFFADSMVADAVVRKLQTLAESATRVSTELRKRFPEVEWRAMARFRNVLVHDYLGLDFVRLWNIVTVNLPVLKQQVKAIRASLSTDA
jgi:uncharacterized protein with HEPN domain